MKNELVTKEVEFNGDLLKATQDLGTGKIYVGVKGQDFLFSYLKKHTDTYTKFDKKYLTRLSEVSANA